MTDIIDDYTTWDAAYVLGSLTRDERLEYEDHLTGCAECRAAVAEFAGLPGMLATVPAETALAMIEPPAEPAEDTATEAPPRVLSRLADAAERRRRRAKWASIGQAVAAAAAAVAIAVPVAVTITGSNRTADTSAQVFAEHRMEALEPTPVTASFSLVSAGERTRLVMSCSYAADEQRYPWDLALYVIRADGQQQELDRWPAGPGTELTIDRTIDGTPDQVRSVEIRAANSGKVLLRGMV
ncbi:anti-sigma factor family protein [Nocardia sp. 004]|uniref:anti-sigma factor family protein n=1 Tax=Nocardia sp. 004 TaxID=3385978 RepID=UPI0039A3BA30